MKRNTWMTPLWLGAALLCAAAGCDDDNDPIPEQADATGLPDGDLTALDASPEADAGEADSALPEADWGPGPHLAAPEAWVYLNDPVSDDGELSRVVLTETVHEDGRLTSPFVEVFNCINEEGGYSARPNFGGLRITISLCHEVQVARPGPDGHYTHIAPPNDPADPNDSFSELMMYHHVNRAHDYFKKVHGFDGLDYALPALVNVQMRTDPPLPIPGMEPGPDGWIPFANAAYFPKEAWDQFAEQFGFPSRDSDLILFGQAEIDFAYDARVIYHEYGHAVVGTDRLSAINTIDEYGLDNSPRSMNEGIADYFAATISDDPVIGRYALGVYGEAIVRDLSKPHRCPDDVQDEVHDQGRLIGSVLWAVRAAVGAEAADAILWGALEQFTEATSHQQAGALLLAEAHALGLEAQVEPILSDFGFLGCVRALPWRDFDARETGRPHVIEGRQTAGLSGMSGGVPAFKQFYVDVPEGGAEGLQLSWTQLSESGIFGSTQPNALEVAVRAGAPINALAAADAPEAGQRWAPMLAGDTQSISLDASCLSEAGERIYFLLFNPAAGASNLGGMGIEWLSQPPSGGIGATVIRCEETPPQPEEDAGVEADAGEPDGGLEADAGEPDGGLEADAGEPDGGLDADTDAPGEDA